ncbi:MAG TPA: hypothetical protein V6D25_05915 [Leptolyngbyaceae cyanobacterium]
MAQGEASIRVYLSPDVKNNFKTVCFLKGVNMSDIAAELIEEWVKQNAEYLPIQSKKTDKGEKAQ